MNLSVARGSKEERGALTSRDWAASGKAVASGAKICRKSQVSVLNLYEDSPPNFASHLGFGIEGLAF